MGQKSNLTQDGHSRLRRMQKTCIGNTVLTVVSTWSKSNISSRLQSLQSASCIHNQHLSKSLVLAVQSHCFATQISAEMESKASKAYYEAFANEAHLTPLNPAPSFDLANSPLNDPKLIKEGQEYVQRNYLSVVLCHLVMMMWGLMSKYGRVVILHTGESNTKEKAAVRDLSTIVRMNRWFEGEFIGSNAGAVKDLEAVRRIHLLANKMHFNRPKPVLPELTEKQKKLLEAIRAETEHIDTSKAPEFIWRDDPVIPLSQLPMSAGQCGFYATLALKPEAFGIADNEGIEGYTHLYAIIGKYLGIEDRYNWALYHKDTKDLTPVRMVLDKIVLPSLKLTDETTIILWQAMIDGIAEYTYVFRFLGVVKYMLNVCELEGKHIDPLMDWKDKLFYWFLMLAVHKFGKYELLRRFRNWLIKLCLRMGERKYFADRKRA